MNEKTSSINDSIQSLQTKQSEKRIEYESHSEQHHTDRSALQDELLGNNIVLQVYKNLVSAVNDNKPIVNTDSEVVETIRSQIADSEVVETIRSQNCRFGGC